MKLNILTLWIAIGVSIIIVTISNILASKVGLYFSGQNMELPYLSKLFYSGDLKSYLYPIPLCIWALIHTLRNPNDKDQSLLLITITLGISMIFLIIFIVALILPFIPVGVTI